jgi:integrase/recombinase XerD
VTWSTPWCLLMSLNGLRVASVVALNRDDLGQERGYRVVTVKGKGGKVQRLPLADVTWQAVRQLIEEREEDANAGGNQGGSGDSSGIGLPPRCVAIPHATEIGRKDVEGSRGCPLFTSPTGERLTRYQAGRIVARLARRAGIQRRLSPHGLRHTWVSLALDAGCSIRDVQLGAGHSDPKTTLMYDQARRSLDSNPTFAVAELVT